ncbi:MAG: AI-2E family transporter [Candidatus Nealsonbacteria bacterium]|nr:AI-2E family transporter [Candidatus Nealsonbacteria bacterium]
MENNKKLLDISWGTVWKIALAVIFIYFLYLIKDILIWFLFALILSILFEPAIDFLQKRKIPRVLATGLIYFSVFGILGFSIYLISPALVLEIQKITRDFPQYLEELTPLLRNLGIIAFEDFEGLLKVFQERLVQISKGVLFALAAIFGGIFTTLTVFVIAFFLSLEEKGIKKAIILFTPQKIEARVLNIWHKSQQKVAIWFGSRVLGCLFVGLACFLTFWIFDINYAFSLSFFAGITNIVPIIGPILAGIVIVILTVLDSWLKAFFVLIAFVLIQQIEGSILTPILTKKFIGLPPALVLISLIIGGQLWGILGAILIIPLAAVIYEFLKDFLKKRKEEETEAVVL